MPDADTLDLSFHLARSPEEVRDWWWSFPEDYRATDPREQPHRIRTLERTHDTVDVMTYWKGPLGRDFAAAETLRKRPDGSWVADVKMMGLHIQDEFRAEPGDEGGTLLRIRSTITPANPFTRVLRPVIVPGLKKSMRRTWKDAAAVCESARRDG